MNHSLELSYYSNAFVYFPLPARRVGNVYSTHSNQGSINYTSPLFVPYGLYSRLALVAITKLAMEAESAVIDTSVYELLKSVRDGRPTGTQLSKMSEQLSSWATTLITLSFNSDERRSYNNLLLCKNSDFRLMKDRGSDEKVHIGFTQDGRDFLSGHSFPLPVEAVKSIQNSFDFDCLCWLISSMYQCNAKDSAYCFAPWKQLFIQFGATPKNQGRFRDAFSEALTKLRDEFYPEAKFSFLENAGIALFKSPLLISKKTNYLVPRLLTL